MKVYILIENFESDYKYSDGYVNCVFSSKELAQSALNRLVESSKGQPYTCRIIEREIL